MFMVNIPCSRQEIIICSLNSYEKAGGYRAPAQPILYNHAELSITQFLCMENPAQIEYTC